MCKVIDCVFEGNINRPCDKTLPVMPRREVLRILHQGRRGQENDSEIGVSTRCPLELATAVSLIVVPHSLFRLQNNAVFLYYPIVSITEASK